MLRKTIIALTVAAAATGGLTADALARGGGFGGGHMGGFGGGHMGGFGGGHMGGFGGGHMGAGFAGRHFAGRGHFDHGRRFRSGFGDFGFYDYGCSYGYPYYNPYSCYLPPY
jgi:hypothetical protein